MPAQNTHEAGTTVARSDEVTERIVSAAVFANEKVYTGATHGEAINKALEDGLPQSELDEYWAPTSDLHLDLFITNKGRLVDRITGSLKFNVSGSEYISRQ